MDSTSLTGNIRSSKAKAQPTQRLIAVSANPADGLRHVNKKPTPAQVNTAAPTAMKNEARIAGDRKSTRLNSSHITISYAVFCLKKKKKKNNTPNIYYSFFYHRPANTNIYTLSLHDALPIYQIV